MRGRAPRTGIAAAAVAAGVLATAACGSPEPDALSPEQARPLHRSIAAARAAAERGDPAAATAALAAFRRRVDRLEAEGAITAGLADDLERRALVAAARVPVEVVPPPPQPVEVAPPAGDDEEPDDDEGDRDKGDKGKRKGEGKRGRPDG